MEESNRQKKIAGVLQSDLANVLQNMLREAGQMGIIISVSKVSVTTDLSIAKVYVSVFPADKAENIVKELNKLKPGIKHQIAQLTKHQLRKMPDLSFYNDDSLEYIEKIDKAVKGEENPLKNPDLLPKRKNHSLNFSLYIAKRYLFSKSSNNAINIITGIAAVGVVVGAMSLFIVLSGFSGLKDFSLQFTNIFDSDLKILPASGKTISFSEAKKEQLNAIAGVETVSKIIEERVFLHYKGKNHIAYIKGVDSLYGKVTQLDSIMYYGDWFVENQNEVVVGLSTIAKLSMGVRDYGAPLEIYVPKPGTGQLNALDPSDAFSKENVVVSGVYQVNEDLDAKYVFTDFEFARNLLSLDSTKISSVEIKLLPNASEENMREEIENIFPEGIIIKNRIQQNDALYKMLNTENIAVYLIFTLVLIIALFNVIGSIIMMVLDKRKNIKTLYNLGASLPEIRRIFFLQGTLMTVLGGFLGIFLGILAVLAQLKFEFVAITSTLPYPVKLELLNIIIVFITISVLGIIASKIASSRVREKLLV